MTIRIKVEDQTAPAGSASIAKVISQAPAVCMGDAPLLHTITTLRSALTTKRSGDGSNLSSHQLNCQIF